MSSMCLAHFYARLSLPLWLLFCHGCANDGQPADSPDAPGTGGVSAATGGNGRGGNIATGGANTNWGTGGLSASGGRLATGGVYNRGGALGSGSMFSLGGMFGFGSSLGFGGLKLPGTIGGATVGGATVGTGGAKVGTGGAAVGVGGNVSSSTDPVLPPISGTCPTFTTGTATIGGLSGISLQVGPKQQGTGSLLFYWHGTGSSSSEVNIMVPSAVRQEILNQGGIIVSFQGSLGTGGDCSGTAIFSKDDFKVADLIAACAVRDHGIDPRRIYATGCSAGGLQSGCMGALRSSYIAAIAPNSGGEIMKQTLQDAANVPAVMTMHGGAADVVGVSFATTSATCDAQMKTAGAFVVNCNHGGGHCQAPAALYTAAWEFMKAHPFGVAPEPYSSGIPADFPSYCQIY